MNIFYSPGIMVKRSQTSQSLIQKERRIFAHNLAEARKQADLTQDDLVKITGLTQSFISKVENAEANVSLDNANRLAFAVKQPLWKLLNPVEK